MEEKIIINLISYRIFFSQRHIINLINVSYFVFTSGWPSWFEFGASRWRNLECSFITTNAARRNFHTSNQRCTAGWYLIFTLKRKKWKIKYFSVIFVFLLILLQGILIQMIGVAGILIWSLLASTILFGILHLGNLLRSSEEDEIIGMYFSANVADWGLIM